MSAERVAIIGAGGHAREVLQILMACRASGTAIEPIGFVDDGPEIEGLLDGLPVLGDFGWFEGADRRDVSVVCAVGTPSLCRRLTERAGGLGLQFASAVSPLAWVATSARLGKGVMVFPNVVVNTGATVGESVSLNVAATVSHDTRVGAFSSVGPGAHLAGNVTLGEGCFVGMGANVIQDVTVGAGSVIGAGAVVLDDVPPGVTVVGVPARVVGSASETPLARGAEQ